MINQPRHNRKHRLQTRVFTAENNVVPHQAVERQNRSRPFSPYASAPKANRPNPRGGGVRKTGHPFKRSRVPSHRDAPMPKEGFRAMGSLKVKENGEEKVLLPPPDTDTL